MLGLTLREEFKGRRMSGTMIELHNSKGSGALDKSASEFLDITYPSTDMLKTIEAVAPGKARPVVIIGARGQGKSHLMAALSHMLKNKEAGEKWINEWTPRLGSETTSKLTLSEGLLVIAESLHLQRYKNLWDILFDQHPKGEYYKGQWEAKGADKTNVPDIDLMLSMLKDQPTALILDEFQTWFEGLTNTKQHPIRNWAFNFIQILSEIAEKHPDLLTLVISVRDGKSDAAQQVYRVNPIKIDFRGPQAKRDRQRLLLYRLFENRLQVSSADIAALIEPHVNELLRLKHIPGAEHDKVRAGFLESWPYAPHLMQLLEDQVLIATQTQETRDLLRILVDVFKYADKKNVPVITAADFTLGEEKSGVASLLDSVSNDLHRDLRTKAIRNIEAVQNAAAANLVPNLTDLLSALWLRSLSLENVAGALPEDLQIDITRKSAVDDNLFQAELATVEENSFNIHRRENRLVFLNEENPQAKLMANAKNDKLFTEGQDIEQLAKEIRYVLVGPNDTVSSHYRCIVLRSDWLNNPWDGIDERDQPQNWSDARIPVIVVPQPNAGNKKLGTWLKNHMSTQRNTVRFLLPNAASRSIFFDKQLLVLARAVYLATEWKGSNGEYNALLTRHQKELRELLKKRFDRFAILEKWNFGEPEKCEFLIPSHKSEGVQILPKIQDEIIHSEFIPEEFEDFVLEAANKSQSVLSLLNELKEPMGGGETCIPWLGEIELKERILRLCSRGKIDINLRGTEMLQAKSHEGEEEAWHRMKGKLGQGRDLESTKLLTPGSGVESGGSAPKPAEEGSTATGTGETSKTGGQTDTVDTSFTGGTTGEKPETGGGTPPFGGGLFGGGSGGSTPTPTRQKTNEPTSGLNLLGKIENWGVTPGTPVQNVSINIPSMTGAQLQELVRKLPEGIRYGLELDKE